MNSENQKLRDTFAAAALTGLIVSMREESWYEVCESAYLWADAMIRQRGTAVLENCVTGNQPEIPCPVTEPMPKEKRAEVSDTNHDAVPEAKANAESVAPQPTAGDRSGQAEGGVPDSRNAKEPVAWLVAGAEYDTGCEFQYVSLFRESAAEAARSGGGVMVPLYRQPQPTLTDAEREAVQRSIDTLDGLKDLCPTSCGADAIAAATLRGLLDRTK